MEDYIMRRREYVQQIRASFDRPTENDYFYGQTNVEETPIDATFFSLKIRFLIAIILFGVIFFCKYYSYPILGMEVSEIIDMICDNQYYTFLQTYVKI